MLCYVMYPLKVITWMESDDQMTKEDLKQRHAELEQVCSPVMKKLHSQSNDTSQSSTKTSSKSSRGKGPTIEEMD